ACPPGGVAARPGLPHGREARLYGRGEAPSLTARVMGQELVVIRDISLGGIGLGGLVPRAAGDRWTLALRAPANQESQVLEAQVVWFRGGKTGLKWLTQDPEQRH